MLNKFSDEKIVVFRCKYCINDLKEYNPYVDDDNKPIKPENIICIEVPDEDCENTSFELMSIPLNQSFYYDIPHKAQVYLLNEAIKNAIEMGCEILIKVWQNECCRDTGNSIEFSLESYTAAFNNPNCPAEELLNAIKSTYDDGGCVEIIASDEYDNYCFYHEETAKMYINGELFDFLKGED